MWKPAFTLLAAALFIGVASEPNTGHAGEPQVIHFENATLKLSGPCCTPEKCRNKTFAESYYWGKDTHISYTSYTDELKCKECDHCKCKSTREFLVTYQPDCKNCIRQVPLTIPGCCCGEPSIKQKTMTAGHHVVTYTWASGFSAKIRFYRNGEVRVIYRS